MSRKKLMMLCGILYSIFLSSMVNASVAFDRQQVEFVPDGGGKPVTLNFDGRIYKKGLGVIIDGKAKDPLAIVVKKIVDANSGADRNKVVDLWNPDERAGIKKQVSNDAMYARNRSMFQNIVSSRMAGFMQYGKYIICFVDHDLKGVGSYIKVYPLLEKSGQYYMTNQLSNDFLFTKFIDNLAQHLWGK